MIGLIAGLATSTSNVRSNMENEVLHFVHSVTKIALVTAIIFFVIGAARYPTKTGIIAAFVNGFILVMVAYVPEGLPATVASCLTIAAQRMSLRHVFIKRPDIIEALGAATVIASDKTGTLTQNLMTVEHLWTNKSTEAVRDKRMLHALAMAAGRTVTGQTREDGTPVAERTLRGPSSGSGNSSPSSSLRAASASGVPRVSSDAATMNTFSTFRSLAASSGSFAQPWSRFSPRMRLQYRNNHFFDGGFAIRTRNGHAL
jgi:magnesium-transporting ATPase (P-type)